MRLVTKAQMRSYRSVSLTIAAAIVAGGALSSAAIAQSTTANRWSVIGNAVADFEIVADSTHAHTGRTSLRVTSDVDPTGFAGVGTFFPAATYAGRRIEVSAVLRTASLGGQGAAVWVRADSGGKSIAFATTQGHRYLIGDLPWTPVTVDLDVPAGASSIALGAISMGRGQLWVDDIRIAPVLTSTTSRDSAAMDHSAATDARMLGFEPPDVLVDRAPSGPTSAGTPLAQSPREAARVLRARGLENLVAFTRLVGYVRFWYPGSAALTTNWDEFTVRGMRVVEQAPTADSLIAILHALFAAVAPHVSVYPTGTAAPRLQHLTDARHDGSVAFWEHCGFGVPVGPMETRRPSPYRSTRRRIAAPAGRVPDRFTLTDCGPARTMSVPNPNAPFIADLGAGVSAAVPLAVWEEALPPSLAASEAAGVTWQPDAATERFSLDDRATRLADVALLWMVPQQFYPYFDVVHTDWPAALRVALGEAAQDRDAPEFDGTLERLIAALHDGHGNAIRPALVQGTPDVLLGFVENRVVVLATGDSARAAGVHVGDELVSIDGRASMDALHEAESRTSGATPQWIRHVALSKMLRGTPGTVTVLRLRDPLVAGSSSRDVRLTRIPQPLPTEARPAKIAELEPGVFYVDLSRVNDDDVARAMHDLETARGIVFDMRGYPSHVNTAALLAHLRDSTLHSARFDLPLVLRPDHTQMRFADVGWVLAPQSPRVHAKVVFMTGGGAISYAESTMGVVEENHLGPIVGETTAGTNGDVNPFTLPGGYTVVWSGLRVEKRDGTPHHGVGIHPTIPATPTLRGVREGKDEVLARALDVLNAK